MHLIELTYIISFREKISGRSACVYFRYSIAVRGLRTFILKIVISRMKVTNESRFTIGISIKFAQIT